MKNNEFGLFPPTSIVWKIHSDPALLIGGIRALFQQALHPEAMAGVAQNSNFRDDVWGRLQRTGDYVTTLTFAEPKDANSLAERVRNIHKRLKLDDPKLLLWVHMSLVDAFLDIAIRSGVPLTQDERDQYVFEMVLFAKLVGINEDLVPRNTAELAEYFVKISPELTASEDAKSTALLLFIPPLPNVVRFATPAAPLWAAIATLAAASLPNWARSLYRWPSLPGQTFTTDVALVALRQSLLLLPIEALLPPVLIEARIRWAGSAA